MDYETYPCSDDLQLQILPGTRQEVKFIYQEVFDSQDYAQAGIQLKDDSTVIDIGANIGMFSLFLLQNHPRIRLIAIEPVKQIYTAMANNLQRYQQPQQQVTTLQAGAGAQQGQSTITYYPGIPANSTFLPSQKQQEFAQMDKLINAQTVGRYNKALVPIYYGLYPFIMLLKPMIKNLMLKRLHQEEQQLCDILTISSLIKQQQLTQIDLLKIDAEGLEYEILQGIDEADWSRISQLAIETSNLMAADNTDKITQLLKQKGYRVTVKPMTRGGELAMVYAL